MSTTTSTTWLTLAQVSREMGLSRVMARKDLRKIRFAYPPRAIQGNEYWDARALDLLRAMRGKPHRTLEPAHADWLARFLKENPDATTP